MIMYVKAKAPSIDQSIAAFLNAILYPSAGLGTFLIYLSFQPKAQRFVKRLMLGYLPCLICCFKRGIEAEKLEEEELGGGGEGDVSTSDVANTTTTKDNDSKIESQIHSTQEEVEEEEMEEGQAEEGGQRNERKRQSKAFASSSQIRRSSSTSKYFLNKRGSTVAITIERRGSKKIEHMDEDELVEEVERRERESIARESLSFQQEQHEQQQQQQQHNNATLNPVSARQSELVVVSL